MFKEVILIRTIFIVNLLCIILSFYYQDQVFGSVAILVSLVFFISSLVLEQRVFNSALFLFSSTLPLALILPVYQNPTLALLIVTLAISFLAFQKKVFDLFRIGNIKNIRVWLAIIAISTISSTSLILWGIWTSNLGVGIATLKEFKQHSSVLILILIPILALLNAAVEEIVFRGIIQTELSNIFNIYLSIFFQAVLFAGFHYAGGFPNGMVGFAMTFVYACALGFMKYRVKGLLAPIITHATADLTIYIFLWVYF